MKRTQGKARRPGPRLDTENLHLLEPEAAAIDVGSRSHWVAVSIPSAIPNRCGNLAASRPS